MTTLLTIGLPTYNRASLLDKQLAWLAQAVKGFEQECEIIISDNCSTDETPHIIEKWKPAFEQIDLRVNRNLENLGVLKNIAYCINHARSKFVWTISDDDTIFPETLPYIIETLTRHPDLAVQALNFSGRDAETGELQYDRRFDIEQERVYQPNGMPLFEQIVAKEKPSQWGGLALTTALIYRTQLAQELLREWPEGLENLALQLVITGYCAVHGSMIVSKDERVEFRAGMFSYENGRQSAIKPFSDKKMHFILRQADAPEAFLQLIKIGYDPYLLRRKIVLQGSEYRWGKKLDCFRKWPATTVAVLFRYFVALTLAQYSCLLSPWCARRIKLKAEHNGKR